MNSYEEMLEESRKSLAVKKQEIFDELRKSAFTQLTIGFNGSGDSGDTVPPEEWEVEGGNLLASLLEEPNAELRESIRDFVWQCLSTFHGGWENNDGGEGQVILDLVHDKVIINMDYFIMERATQPQMEF